MHWVSAEGLQQLLYYHVLHRIGLKSIQEEAVKLKKKTLTANNFDSKEAERFRAARKIVVSFCFSSLKSSVTRFNFSDREKICLTGSL